MFPDFSWSCIDIKNIKSKFNLDKYIILFPFCSPHLTLKKWPYYNDLIKIIKSKHSDLEIVIAPGPNEIEEAKKIDAVIITNDNKPLNIMELAGLIKKSSFVISNDTGPAHMAAHLGKKGLVLFGHHTTSQKVSIETGKFKALNVGNLEDLSVENVYEKVKDELEKISN